MKYLIYSIICCFYFIGSLSNIQKKKITGKYINKDRQHEIIYLHEDSTFLYLDESYLERKFLCKDTLAKGYWRWDNGKKFIRLFNYRYENYDYINSYVKSSYGHNRDSIYIIIFNPIESSYKENHNPLKRYINYSIYPDISDTKTLRNIITTKNINNKIQFKNPEQNIISIMLNINPINDIKGQREASLPKNMVTNFKLNTKSNNIFEIYLPDLTYCYLTGFRLNDDFVKVLKNELEWDGKIYKKVK